MVIPVFGILLLLLFGSKPTLKLSAPLEPLLGKDPPHRTSPGAATFDVAGLDSIAAVADTGLDSIAAVADGNTPTRTSFIPDAPVHLIRGALDEAACLRFVASAAAHGGWTTGRHHLHPTTDIPAMDLPGGVGTEALDLARDVVLPAIAAAFRPERGVNSLSFRDLFLARYDADPEKGQAGLGKHKDGSVFSFNALLSEDGDDFRGGGTWVEPVGVVRPRRGDILLHRGDLLHEGRPVTSGTRHVLVGFVQVDDDVGDNVGDENGSRRSELVLRTVASLPLGMVVEVDTGLNPTRVLVTEVSAGGEAAQADVRRGDLLRGLLVGKGEGELTPFDSRTFEDVMGVLAGRKDKGPVRLVVERWAEKGAVNENDDRIK
ncbi:hypothetical protein TrVE_jg1038 [Triparma verrucosa]|uniref:Fe2OG dioxygenase domain-containing protein n=1 Tax=Triparma verrucosa TaxID=1606542 RepID=A0A9W7BC37_9STRA|nr:hypothetical protein TrVE_jg1038 [Triparma verrucosa]